MKKILVLSACVLFTGCFSGPVISSSEYNAIIPLGQSEVGIFIPTNWEKLNLPSASENVVLLARSGSQNLALSLETNSKTTNGESLCEGAKNGFSPFELVLVTENECRFRGRVSANTPMREFWQKIVKAPKSDNFLLASCSQETRASNMRDCQSIINSFGILDKK